MSKTWNFLSVGKPNLLPHATTVNIEASVTGIQYADENKPIRDGELFFLMAPTYIGSSVIIRRLTFSKEKEPQLDYSYIEAGCIKLDGEDVFLLLESN